MAIAPGDRVELVATDDPDPNLRPGDRGTIVGIRDVPERAIAIARDDGSALSILPGAGDQIRKLPHDPPMSGPGSNPPAQPILRAAHLAPHQRRPIRHPAQAALTHPRGPG